MRVGSLLLAGLLLVANGFFVAVEFALVTSRRTKLEPLAEEGHGGARAAIAAMRDLNVQLAGAQLGITMASLLLGFVAEPAVAHLVEDAVEVVVELPDAALHGIGFAVALTIVVFLHMVIGEMVPKNIALAAPERTLLALTLPNRGYLAVFRPLVRLLNGAARLVVRALGVELRDEIATAATAEELSRMIGSSHEEGLLEASAHGLLTRALDLSDRPVREVMVPRDGVVWVPRTAAAAEAEAAMFETGHTRLVVSVGEPRLVDDVLGFVHAKDLLTLGDRARRQPLPLSRIRPMPVIDVGTHLDDALVAMQRARIHMALVADGREAVGLATLEDVLESLVGDIRDESDADHPM